MEINRLLEAYRTGAEKSFFKTYFLDVAPQSDDRPFPSRFLKWTRLDELYKSTGSRLYSLLLSGEIVVSVFLLKPSCLHSSFGNSAACDFKETEKAFPAQIFYFFSVGAGFMFVELFFIKKYVILFGDRWSVSRSFFQESLFFPPSEVSGQPHRKRVFEMQRFFWLHPASPIFQPGFHDVPHARFSIYHDWLRQSWSFSVELWWAFPFPSACDIIGKPIQRAYAWAVNGCASVLTSILSVPIPSAWESIY